MKNSLSFKMFLKNNSNSMATKYPFLSRSQINSRLRAEWKKISETNKQKRTNNFSNSQESTFNLNLSPNVFNGKFRSIKPVRNNTKGVGRGFQFHGKDHSKLKPSRLWSPGLQIKSEQGSKSTLVQENMYDLGVDLDEYDNIDIDPLKKARNKNMEPQDIEKQSFLENKFSECERKRTPLKKLKDKQSSKPFLGGERHGVSTELNVQSKTSLYCDRTYSKDETKQETPVSEDELFDDYDNDNLNSYDEDDDENAVLLIRKDNCLTQVFDQNLGSFNDDATSSHENDNFVTEDIMLTKYQYDITGEKNNCLLETESSNNTADSANTKHSMTLRRESLKPQSRDNIFQSKMLPTETNSTENYSQSAKQENISTSEEKVECMTERLFHLTEESKPNNLSDVKVSPNSATSSPTINEGSTESIFYSYHDNTEDTDIEIKRTSVISHMFEEAEAKRMNSISTPSRRRLLASSRFQTPSNFKMMLFDEEDIFGFC
ncbi:uncharacterized protein LOC106057308 isoform X1 [Biomphalaria glabrata]|uniref:Uncharacterized protein LOC106057308 isoform X1 n=2 Tax=Biomphalaria glabrata TaxID=6526 RepID=A0A9U8E391_BIOGL|nr:uncharacterized protein LOC106057308 isoform X1 [Biomphalaria glabrata]KAI8734076.1 hypothetical protein BgiMline_028303 [Biomphalaria glabrata]